MFEIQPLLPSTRGCTRSVWAEKIVYQQLSPDDAARLFGDYCFTLIPPTLESIFMTISQTQLDQVLSEQEIKKFWLGYFQERFREEIHQQLLEHYNHIRASTNLSRTDLARKIGRRPEQVTRWLSAPTNLEADTISDMALAMGMVPRVRFEQVQVSIRGMG